MTDASWLAGARNLLAALVDLALPAVCAVCGVPISGAALCELCLSGLMGRPARVRPDPCPPGLPTTFAVTSYDGVARAALLAHKEQGRLALARPLGEALATAVEAAIRAGPAAGPPRPAAGPAGPGGGFLLVPVPTARAAVRQRGHDPTGRIVAVAAATLRRRGVPVRRLPVLRHRRRIADQAGLSSAQRAANLQGALYVPQGRCGLLCGAPVIVLDDVLTTGATLAEASRALRAAGAQVLAAAVVAATRRRRRSALSRRRPAQLAHSERLRLSPGGPIR